MAVKTITIDMEAYNLLAAEKRDDESFSRLIKRRLGAVCTAKALLDDLPKLTLSEDTLDRAEEIVQTRRESQADSPVMDLGE